MDSLSPPGTSNTGMTCTVQTFDAVDDVACMCMVTPSVVAIGSDDGALHMFALPLQPPFHDHRPSHHAGGTLCLVSVVAEGADAGQLIISGGGDGFVRAIRYQGGSVELVRCWKLLLSSGGAIGVHGLLVDCISASTTCWAALTGRTVAIGFLSQSATASVVTLAPAAHVHDALQILPDGSIATASFGGLSLWRRSVGGGSGTARYHRTAPLPAARHSPDADLACDGWARSLSASPDGEWLAAGVNGTRPALWFWRVADGADFECGGFEGPGVSILAWSSDSTMLASAVADQVHVWSLRRPPDRKSVV